MPRLSTAFKGMHTFIEFLLFIMVFAWNDGSVNYVILVVDIQRKVTVLGDRGEQRVFAGKDGARGERGFLD